MVSSVSAIVAARAAFRSRRRRVPVGVIFVAVVLPATTMPLLRFPFIPAVIVMPPCAIAMPVHVIMDALVGVVVVLAVPD